MHTWLVMFVVPNSNTNMGWCELYHRTMPTWVLLHNDRDIDTVSSWQLLPTWVYCIYTMHSWQLLSGWSLLTNTLHGRVLLSIKRNVYTVTMCNRILFSQWSNNV